MLRIIALSSVCLLVGFATAAVASENEKMLATQGTNSGSACYEAVKINEHRADIVVLYKFPGWFKPAGEQKNFKGSNRLVLKLSGDGKAELNPKNEGAFSSQVVDLHSLTLQDAEMLWGKARKMPNGITTFDLLSTPEGFERDIYHLDTKFTDTKLDSYQIRGIRITVPEWRSVDP